MRGCATEKQPPLYVRLRALIRKISPLQRLVMVNTLRMGQIFDYK